MKLPLEGITILDVTEVHAGPMGTTLLGDLGARVIKVESFPRLSTTRLPGGHVRGYTNNDPFAPRPWDRSAAHNMANRNKYGVTLNLTHPKGLDTLKQLAKLSDVFVEAYAPGTVEKLGIDYAAMKTVKPDIIMVSMPGWGVEGPYKGYVSLGHALDGFTGHHALRGYPDTDPSVTPVCVHVDAIAAVTLATAILLALFQRTSNSDGQWIDLSQVESFLPHLSTPLMDYVMNGRQPVPFGNRDRTMAPHGCYRCLGSDEWIVITISSDEEWTALCQAMGDPEWTRSTKFEDRHSRYENHDELDGLIQAWTLQKDKKELMQLLQGMGIPAEAVLDEEDVNADPHLETRGFFQRVTQPFIGEYRYPGYLWKFSKIYEPVRIPPNSLGEHNRYIFGTLLGMSDDEIAYMEAQGITGDQVET